MERYYLLIRRAHFKFIFHELIYNFKTISINIPADFFDYLFVMVTDMLILKLICNCKMTKINKTYLKNNKIW